MSRLNSVLFGVCHSYKGLYTFILISDVKIELLSSELGCVCHVGWGSNISVLQYAVYMNKIMGFETRPCVFLSASPLTSCLLWARYLTSVRLNFITSKNEDAEVIVGINENACKKCLT